MRFAMIATSVAALAGAPLLSVAAGPRMDGQEFLTAARCAAYESVSGGSANFGETRYQLNLEARRQPTETAYQARAEIGAIARQAASIENASEAAILRREQASACANAQSAESAAAHNAV